MLHIICVTLKPGSMAFDQHLSSRKYNPVAEHLKVKLRAKYISTTKSELTHRHKVNTRKQDALKSRLLVNTGSFIRYICLSQA